MAFLNNCCRCPGESSPSNPPPPSISGSPFDGSTLLNNCARWRCIDSIFAASYKLSFSFSAATGCGTKYSAGPFICNYQPVAIGCAFPSSVEAGRFYYPASGQSGCFDDGVPLIIFSIGAGAPTYGTMQTLVQVGTNAGAGGSSGERIPLYYKRTDSSRIDCLSPITMEAVQDTPTHIGWSHRFYFEVTQVPIPGLDTTVWHPNVPTSVTATPI